ncbi:DUF5713 family protein [Streptomyces halstedii]|uniref:DUF5713 family protein n=1 Tax=Streptomyces TaxID=1883 RepID=UPI0004A95451|nr:DUF5713 family protein [Streptomyces sp. NTK 937]KDQ67427.1 hypothetical protein DT87_09410 [Streptomyces sp. NTK 937]WSX38021.1 DUF5713 family protein [Streptomyces halstedii]
MAITNERMRRHAFLQGLYDDAYFPDHVVDRGKAVLVRLCETIETRQPADLAALYALTHAATEEFNALEAEFEAAGSEIETAAREEIAEDFWLVATAYGFAEADVEQLIAPREW